MSEENTATAPVTATEPGSSVEVSEPAPESATSTASPYSAILNEDGTISENAADNMPSEWRQYEGVQERLARFSGKPLASVFQSYGELEKLTGKLGNSVLLPSSNSSPDDIAEYRQKVGAPENVEGYGLHEKPQDYEGEWNNDLGKAVAEVLHEAHAPKALAEKLMATYNREQERLAMAMEQDAAKEREEADSQLREMWGAEYDARRDGAERIARAFAFDLSEFTAADVAQVFAQIHESAKEDPTVQRALNLSETKMAAGNPKVKYEEIMQGDAYQGKKGHAAQEAARKEAYYWMGEYSKQQEAVGRNKHGR